jgi:transketolase
LAFGCLYPILADLGYFPAAELSTFTRLGSNLGDHPDMNKVPGVDFSSGALGHALAISAGMALAARLSDRPTRTVALLGDGELNEGQVWESAALVAAQSLGNLMAIVDVNGVCVDGSTNDVLQFGSLADKWRAFGWTVEELDGHDLGALLRAYERFAARGPHAAPTVLLAATVSGRGISFIEGMAEWHLGYLGPLDVARAHADIDAMYPAAI